jgi:hypothetical protein
MTSTCYAQIRLLDNGLGKFAGPAGPRRLVSDHSRCCYDCICLRGILLGNARYCHGHFYGYINSNSCVSSIIVCSIRADNIRPVSDGVLLFVEPPNGSNDKRAAPRWLAGNGALVDDPNSAAEYYFSAGQLISKNEHLSTSGLVRYQVFAASSITLPYSRTFSIVNDSLQWEASIFAGGKSKYCLLGDFVYLDFAGQPPSGCIPISLGVAGADDVLNKHSTTTISTTTSKTSQLPQSTVVSSTTIVLPPSSTASPSIGTVTSNVVSTSSITTTIPTTGAGASPSSPDTITGQYATANLLGCFESPVEDLAIPGPGYTVGTLGECVDYCAGFTVLGETYNYAGVQSGRAF